ncbi:pilus assembly protein N-terminal domain-containing protein [Maritalea mediterranea]|uniref:Pilus assembly protein N-terminal domain-containing protein n=1 Tax=Maritalea mediterranea TaxID=2909667 RepID=A0ABS9E6E2_9HYPH|nr:pilus assembly protein N-terminal domain-containing protein [Maritalea mediterranea]MCF4097469.1 pilus assembly protein N-terminal domain-containing protein [Maritalea mediterranea]
MKALSSWLVAGAMAAGLLAFSNVSASLAADPKGEVDVQVNMARILRLPSAASTVVIGNPAIADATIQDPETIVLTGKTFGHTNLIALDAVGNPIADLKVEVVAQQDNLVLIYNGLQRNSVSCTPECGPALMMGDDVDYLGQVAGSKSIVENAAE